MGAPSGLGLWIWKHWDCDGGRVDDIIARCHRSGVTWLAIKAADGKNPWFGPTGGHGHWTLDDARANFRALRDANIGVYTWHYSYPPTYERELEIMRELLGYEGVCGHIVDAEGEWEADARKAAAFADGISKLRTDLGAWIAHAPFYKPSVHGGFPFRQLGAACDAVMPQAYWTARRGGVDEVTRTVDDETADFHAPSDDAVAPIGITYGSATSPDEAVTRFRADDLRTFLAHYSAKPFVSLWSYDEADASLWPALEAIAADAGAGAAHGLTLIDAGGAGALSRELADRVNAHLSRAMSTVLVPGGSLEERAATVQRKRANLVLSVNASAETRGGATRSEVWTHTKSSDSSRRFGHALGLGLRATARSADLVMLRPEVVGPHAAACLLPTFDGA
jgi:hypothetical protein